MTSTEKLTRLNTICTQAISSLLDSEDGDKAASVRCATEGYVVYLRTTEADERVSVIAAKRTDRLYDLQAEVERLTRERDEARAALAKLPDSFTRQQVEAMLRIALTDRTDEWTIKSVDERVAALLAMFTKEKP